MASLLNISADEALGTAAASALVSLIAQRTIKRVRIPSTRPLPRLPHRKMPLPLLLLRRQRRRRAPLPLLPRCLHPSRVRRLAAPPPRPRALPVPRLSARAAEFVLDGAVTLSNKTLAAPSVTGTLTSAGAIVTSATAQASLGVSVNKDANWYAPGCLYLSGTDPALTIYTASTRQPSGATCATYMVTGTSTRFRTYTNGTPSNANGWVWETSNNVAVAALNTAGAFQCRGTLLSEGGVLSSTVCGMKLGRVQRAATGARANHSSLFRNLAARAALLESGFLPSGQVFSANEYGGAVLAVTPATALLPAHAILQTYATVGAENVAGGTVDVGPTAVTIAPYLITDGAEIAGVDFAAWAAGVDADIQGLIIGSAAQGVWQALDAGWAALNTLDLPKFFPTPKPPIVPVSDEVFQESYDMLKDSYEQVLDVDANTFSWGDVANPMVEMAEAGSWTDLAGQAMSRAASYFRINAYTQVTEAMEVAKTCRLGQEWTPLMASASGVGVATSENPWVMQLGLNAQVLYDGTVECTSVVCDDVVADTVSATVNGRRRAYVVPLAAAPRPLKRAMEVAAINTSNLYDSCIIRDVAVSRCCRPRPFPVVQGRLTRRLGDSVAAGAATARRCRPRPSLAPRQRVAARQQRVPLLPPRRYAQAAAAPKAQAHHALIPARDYGQTIQRVRALITSTDATAAAAAAQATADDAATAAASAQTAASAAITSADQAKTTANAASETAASASTAAATAQSGALAAMRRRVADAATSTRTAVKSVAALYGALATTVSSLLTSPTISNPTLTGLVGGDYSTVTTYNTWVQLGTFGARFDGVIQAAGSGASRHHVYNIRISYDYSIVTPYVSIENSGVYSAAVFGNVCITNLAAYGTTHTLYLHVTAVGNTQVAVSARSNGTLGSIFAAFTPDAQVYGSTPRGTVYAPAVGLNVSSIAFTTAVGGLVDIQRLLSASYSYTTTSAGSTSGVFGSYAAIGNSAFTALGTSIHIQCLFTGRHGVQSQACSFMIAAFDGDTYEVTSEYKLSFDYSYSNGVSLTISALAKGAAYTLTIARKSTGSVVDIALNNFVITHFA